MNSILTLVMLLAGSSCAGASNSDAQQAADTPSTSQASTPAMRRGISLPDYMLPGPIDPVWGDDEVMLVAIAHIGSFSNIQELQQSQFFPIWNSCYPGLSKINDIIDTGDGDLWYIRPLGQNYSLAINEYNMDMFNGEQPEGSGKVYYRTEEAQPILLRMSAYDPGSVQINVVDNEGHSISWIPTMTPADNVLRDAVGVTDVTYHPIDWLVELGADYLCDLGNKSTTLRFYGNGLVNINGELGHYVSFHLNNNPDGVGLYYIDSKGREGTAIITKFEQNDQAFNLQHLKGYDLGIDSFATFLKQ